MYFQNFLIYIEEACHITDEKSSNYAFLQLDLSNLKTSATMSQTQVMQELTALRELSTQLTMFCLFVWSLQTSMSLRMSCSHCAQSSKAAKPCKRQIMSVR